MTTGRGYKFDWNGGEVRRKVVRAAARGINATMGECVEDAQSNTPWITGNLRRSIKIQELAREVNGRIVGLWGSADVDYALYVETGTRGRPGRNMLRGAAAAKYPGLGRNIKSYL